MRVGREITWLARLVLCALLLAYDSGVSRAEETPEASAAELNEARVLFQRGVALAEQHQFAPAAQRFREALAIHYAPAVAYNLAAALFELREYEESFDQLQSVLRDASTSAELRERAQKLEQALSPQVARLTVLASGSGAEAAVVRLDGQVLERAQLGVARAVTPGSHRLSAEREGERVSERSIEVPAGTAVIIDVSLIVTDPNAASPAVGPAAPAPVAAAAPLHSDRVDDRARRRKIWIWTGVAAGVAVLGAGIALAVVLSQDEPARPAGSQGDFMPGVLTWR